MNKYFTVLSFVLIVSSSFGQNNIEGIDLLNKRKIKPDGIEKRFSYGYTNIELAQQSEFIKQKVAIEGFPKDDYHSENKSSSMNTSSKFGYVGFVELGYQSGTGVHDLDRVKLNFINGYQFNPYFSLGFGIGLRNYFTQNATFNLKQNATLIPFFVDLRTRITNQQISPYVSLGAGYSFDPSNHFKGVGFLFNPSLGVSFRVAEDSYIHLGLDYERQRMKFSYIDYPSFQFITFTDNANAVGVNLGISF